MMEVYLIAEYRVDRPENFIDASVFWIYHINWGRENGKCLQMNCLQIIQQFPIRGNVYIGFLIMSLTDETNSKFLYYMHRLKDVSLQRTSLVSKGFSLERIVYIEKWNVYFDYMLILSILDGKFHILLVQMDALFLFLLPACMI